MFHAIRYTLCFPNFGVHPQRKFMLHPLFSTIYHNVWHLFFCSTLGTGQKLWWGRSELRSGGLKIFSCLSRGVRKYFHALRGPKNVFFSEVASNSFLRGFQIFFTIHVTQLEHYLNENYFKKFPCTSCHLALHHAPRSGTTTPSWLIRNSCMWIKIDVQLAPGIGIILIAMRAFFSCYA